MRSMDRLRSDAGDSSTSVMISLTAVMMALVVITLTKSPGKGPQELCGSNVVVFERENGVLVVGAPVVRQAEGEGTDYGPVFTSHTRSGWPWYGGDKASEGRWYNLEGDRTEGPEDCGPIDPTTVEYGEIRYGETAILRAELPAGADEPGAVREMVVRLGALSHPEQPALSGR